MIIPFATENITNTSSQFLLQIVIYTEISIIFYIFHLLKYLLQVLFYNFLLPMSKY